MQSPLRLQPFSQPATKKRLVQVEHEEKVKQGGKGETHIQKNQGGHASIYEKLSSISEKITKHVIVQIGLINRLLT